VADPTQDYSEAARQRAADAGEALPDGSYPMRTCHEVGDAITAYPRAPESHQPQLAQLIRKRDAELECGHDLDALGGRQVDSDE